MVEVIHHSATRSIHMYGSHARNPSHLAWHSSYHFRCGYPSLLPRSFPTPLHRLTICILYSKISEGPSLSSRVSSAFIRCNWLLFDFFDWLFVWIGLISSFSWLAYFDRFPLFLSWLSAFPTNYSADWIDFCLIWLIIISLSSVDWEVNPVFSIS